MSNNTYLLNTPPQLCQLQLYKETEAMMACWATAAEMVAKWNNPNTYFSRPKFIVPSTEKSEAGTNDRVRYELYIENWLDSWGFRTQNRGSYGAWSEESICTLLQQKGPLLCIGSYGGNTGGGTVIGGSAHAICVYGYSAQLGGVFYIDPWDADTKRMSLTSFQHNLWQSLHSVYARIPNYRTPDPVN